MVELRVNGLPISINADPETPLLWVLRDELGLRGTKFTCGKGICGVCVVLVDGEPTRSCVTSLAEVAQREVLTIEGLAYNPTHPVLKAWIAQQVPQCGYCQSGQILTAVALLEGNPSPSDEDIDSAMRGVLCRCGTYQRIRRAIKQAMQEQQ